LTEDEDLIGQIHWSLNQSVRDL